MLPYTVAEWSKAVAEVKAQFLQRRYRPCSVRCSEILDHIKNPVSTPHCAFWIAPIAHQHNLQATVEPAYLIYLHFYAAASLEMSAKPLSASSPYRNNLLRQARTHYQQASELIQSEDQSMKRFSRHSSTNSSSMHSPVCSVSSRAWSESTGFSSPTPSLASLEEEVERMVLDTIDVAPRKKRVTFSDEPIIRPDSPTLGFDDWLGRSSPDPLPQPALRTAMVSRAEPPVEDVPDVDDSLFLRERSIHRYTSVLSQLRAQVTSHLGSVEAQLAKPAGESLAPASGRSTPEVPLDNEELRGLELKARVERLRKNGWQRKRFDPSRYEALREQALAELR
jgi:hypothetical protein